MCSVSLTSTTCPMVSLVISVLEPTLADAILDRLVHNAYKINLKRQSIRKNNPHLTINTNNE